MLRFGIENPPKVPPLVGENVNGGVVVVELGDGILIAGGRCTLFAFSVGMGERVPVPCGARG